MTKSAYDLVPSQEWSSVPWYDPTQPRHFMPTEWKIYNAGKASGTIIGGNLSTFGLLRGTPYAPQVNDYILFLEEAEEDDYHDFDRNLAAILQASPIQKRCLSDASQRNAKGMPNDTQNINLYPRQAPTS